MVRAVAAMVLVAAIAAPAAATTVKDGVDAWQRGDYARAVSDWRPLAEQGDADAAFNLAQAYKLGRGVPSSLAQAKTWYGKAAEAGHVQGAADYGLLLFQDGQRKSAMPWITKASDAGDPRAQYVYGTALFNGDVAPRDWPRAYALMTRAAAAGLPQATTSLAQMDKFMSLDDRRAGLQMATRLASMPVPASDRHLVTDNSPLTPAVAGAQPASAMPVPTKALQAKPIPAKPANAPVPIIATVGGKWSVQLGAFGSQDGAKTAWTTLVGKAASLRTLKPAYQKAGAVIRLRAGPLADRASAARACSAATAAGSACFPVAP